jgi:hypothetical protein
MAQQRIDLLGQLAGGAFVKLGIGTRGSQRGLEAGDTALQGADLADQWLEHL